MLARSPEEITVGQIVKVLEGEIDLASCVKKPEECNKSSDCLTRGVWKEATKAMFDKLNAVTLSKMIENNRNA